MDRISVDTANIYSDLTWLRGVITALACVSQPCCCGSAVSKSRCHDQAGHSEMRMLGGCKCSGGGGCACGAVRYAVGGEPRQLVACHCTHCQRRFGTAFGMSLFLTPDALRITKGELKATRRVADSGRVDGNLPSCGTMIFAQPEWKPADTIVLKPGTLDDTDSTDIHIWTSSKQDWVIIPEGVPSFPRQPD